jgi:hypothetical protein
LTDEGSPDIASRMIFLENWQWVKKPWTPHSL